MLIGATAALEVQVEALKEGLRALTVSGCDLGQDLETIFLKYPTEEDLSTPTEPCKIILPKSERRETYIDTQRGIDGKAPKAAPGQDNRQGSREEAPGDDGSAD